MEQFILRLIIQIATLNHIDPTLALSVVEYESGFNRNAIGTRGEIGLFQIMPSNYPTLSRKQLSEPITNIRLGIALLADAKKTCIHQKDNTWLVCYNVGNSKAKNIKHPKLFKYYKDVMRKYQKGQKVLILYHGKHGIAVYLQPSFKDESKHLILINDRLVIEVSEQQIKIVA